MNSFKPSNKARDQFKITNNMLHGFFLSKITIFAPFKKNNLKSKKTFLHLISKSKRISKMSPKLNQTSLSAINIV